MPRLNTIISCIGRENIDRNKLTGILKSMDYGPSYSHATVYDDHRVGVFSSGYDGYPGQLIEFDGKMLIIEGTIYNKTGEQVKDDLSRILPRIAADTSQTDKLREFMFNTGGEYIIYYIDKEASAVIIFNDSLGAVATANEAVRRRLRTVLRLIKKPSDIGLRTVELKFMEQFTKYLVDAVNQNPAIRTRMDTNTLLKLIQSEKYLHKLYVSGNLVKYMGFVDGKNEMTGALP